MATVNKPAFDDLDPGDFLKCLAAVLVAIIVPGAVYMSIANIFGIYRLF